MPKRKILPISVWRRSSCNCELRFLAKASILRSQHRSKSRLPLSCHTLRSDSHELYLRCYIWRAHHNAWVVAAASGLASRYRSLSHHPLSSLSAFRVLSYRVSSAAACCSVTRSSIKAYVTWILTWHEILRYTNYYVTWNHTWHDILRRMKS